MKQKLCLLTLILLAGCGPSTDKHGNLRVQEDAIYIKDARGRCLRIEIGIVVTGTETAQFGKLDVFEVQHSLWCGPDNEKER